ncbi:MAG: hypothetical protein J6B86_04375 [Clostridia bacterium]|nr:hypothetical protein [Clostridia bacterium]
MANQDMREMMWRQGITQESLIVKLRERGLHVTPSEMSRTLRGVLVSPKAKRVLEECHKILNV